MRELRIQIIMILTSQFSLYIESEMRGGPNSLMLEVDITVERINDGEVSTYLHDVLVPGDRIEARGPIGGYFVWEATMAEQLLLIAGGSGVVLLKSMIRHGTAAGAKNPISLLYSSPNFEDIIYHTELEKLRSANGGLQVSHTLTRSQPAGWKGDAWRIDQDTLNEVTQPLGRSVQVYICGPTLLVEAAAKDVRFIT